jgi:hypothetical protein
MLNKRFTIILFLEIIFITFAFCGPFGLDMGMSLDQIKQKTGEAPVFIVDDYYTVKPPNTNNLFIEYFVNVHPVHGVYCISAIGKDINTTGYGFEIKNTFDDIVTSIKKTYGECTKFDFLQAKSIWNEPNDFMMALVKKERTLAASWNEEQGSTLPNDIYSIFLNTQGISSSKGRIILVYSSTNKAMVDAEKKAEQDSVF